MIGQIHAVLFQEGFFMDTNLQTAVSQAVEQSNAFTIAIWYLIGDGKIFISDVEDIVRVSTGESGFDALQDHN